jgi:DNA-directed RNA polymerase subunit RPC12/RpoP
VNLRAVLVLLAALVVILRLLLARQKRHALLAAAAARGLRCPDCGARRVVGQKALALPPDAGGKSLDLKAIACRACTFRGLAVHAGDAAPRGYHLDWQEHAAFALAIDRCPTPTDPACACPAHRRFGNREGDRWIGLAEVTRDPLGFELD